MPAYAEDTPSFSDSDLRKYNYGSKTTRDLDAAIEGWEDLRRSRRELDEMSGGGIYQQALDNANNRIYQIQQKLDKDRNAFFKHDRLSGSRRRALNKELRQLQQSLPVLRAALRGEFERALEIQNRNEEIAEAEAQVEAQAQAEAEAEAQAQAQAEARAEAEAEAQAKRKGAIDIKTGKFYPPSGEGIIDPKTGQYYPPAGDHGYINPRTGEFMPVIK